MSVFVCLFFVIIHTGSNIIALVAGCYFAGSLVSSSHNVVVSVAVTMSSEREEVKVVPVVRSGTSMGHRRDLFMTLSLPQIHERLKRFEKRCPIPAHDQASTLVSNVGTNLVILQDHGTSL